MNETATDLSTGKRKGFDSLEVDPPGDCGHEELHTHAVLGTYRQAVSFQVRSPRRVKRRLAGEEVPSHT